MGWRKRLWAWLCWLPLVGCAANEFPEPIPAGAERFAGYAVGYLTPATLERDGVERSYWVYLPAGYDASQPLPLVVNLHAYNAAGPKQEQISRMRPLADVHGFILVYPEARGEPAAWDFTPGLAANADTQFIAALLDQLAGQLAVDQDRQFVMGLSNGGGMAHRLACDLGDRFRAAAMVAGVYPAGSPCAATTPIPILAFHGDADSVVPYAGGGANNLLPVSDWATAWAERNDCQDQTEEVTPSYRHTRWTNCSSATSVQLYTLTTWDHFWPDPANVPEDMADPGVNASELIWTFFAGE